MGPLISNYIKGNAHHANSFVKSLLQLCVFFLEALYVFYQFIINTMDMSHTAWDCHKALPV